LPAGDDDYEERGICDLKPWLRPMEVLFGATILGSGVNHGFLARKLMDITNAKGIFSNRSIDGGLQTELEKHFEDHLCGLSEV